MATQSVEPPAKLLLSASEAAELLSISQRTLWANTVPRGPIPSIRVGARVLYSTTLLQGWIASQVVVARETTA